MSPKYTQIMHCSDAYLELWPSVYSYPAASGGHICEVDIGINVGSKFVAKACRDTYADISG